jgi:hypothetical protein
MFCNVKNTFLKAIIFLLDPDLEKWIEMKAEGEIFWEQARLKAGWPDEFVKKSAKMKAKPGFVKINASLFQLKKLLKSLRYFCNFHKNYPK